jgi:tRNA threonylcarbamoyladenosine biosynthesis protein TsaB
MRVLALDSTTRDGSVALVEDDRIVDERVGDRTRTHAERLPGELTTLVDANGFTLNDLDLVAVASGPGSFTGLRVGVATMQALAFVLRVPIVGVTALEAIAHLASLEVQSVTETLVGAWLDARRRDVFSSLWRVKGDAPPFSPERLEEADGQTVAAPDLTLERWRARLSGDSLVFAGDGTIAYREAIDRILPDAKIVSVGPLAGAVGRIAQARVIGGGLEQSGDPSTLQVVYVRRPDAEVARERDASSTQGLDKGIRSVSDGNRGGAGAPSARFPARWGGGGAPRE